MRRTGAAGAPAAAGRLGSGPERSRPLPEQVGRRDARNVVLAGARITADGSLSADIRPDPGNPLFDAAADERARATLLTEATRQAAVLAACELRGFTAAYCATYRWSGQFPPDLGPAAPLSCRAVPGPVTRDGTGRPSVTFQTTLLRERMPLTTIATTLVLDC